MDSLCAFLQQNIIKRAEAFISMHPDSYVTPSIIMSTYRRKSDLTKLEDHHSKLAVHIKNSTEGKELRKWITDLSKRKETGDFVENFNLKDTKGNMFQLKSLLQTNKYVLIDFWATWCAPCIREFPYLKSAYNEFHSSGLEIVGISLDDNEDKFLDFLKKNQLPWKQFLDKNGKDVAVKGFNIQSIPANFLVDRNFQIIAYKLTGEDLSNTLRKLLSNQPASPTRIQSNY
jgi:peroxiredoxin